MPVSQAFLDMARDLLAPLGAVSARRMFGGAGIYCDGVMFSLIEDDVMACMTTDKPSATV